MEHLPLPHDANVVDRARVPFVCTEPYDGGTFMEYSMRLTPPLESLLPAMMRDTHRWPITFSAICASDLESIMQTWLLFGLVREIIGADLSVNAITIESDSQGPSHKYLSTSGLYEAVRQWISECQTSSAGFADEESRERRFHHYMQCFWHVNHCLRAMEMFNTKLLKNVKTSRPFNEVIIHSIASVAEILVAAVNITCQRGLGRGHLLPFGQFGQNTSVDESMRSNGWCPSDIALINHTSGSFATLYYLSNMKQPFGTEIHKECTEMECVHLQNDLHGYKIAHRAKECTCAMLATKITDLDRAYASVPDSHPVIRIVKDSPESIPLLEVVKFDLNSDIKYVAISHVWADGMGNPNDNAMPTCQLEYLSHITQDLQQYMAEEEKLFDPTNVCVLIDTLTFPTGSEDHLKATALARMGTIYENATCVLVLDSQLITYRYQDLDDYEAFMRICRSRWATRLWTLQEGALARRLWVQFSDRAVDMNQLLHTIRKGQDEFRNEAIIAVSLSSSYYLFKSFRNKGQLSNIHPLSSVSSSVWSRNCSVVNDQALCMATLMDLDTKTIADSDPDQRMQTLWRVIAASKYGIPSQIIVNKGPRIDVEGFRWAPASLLRASGCISHMDGRYADLSLSKSNITDKGLSVRFPGYLLSYAPIRFHFSDELRSIWSRSTDFFYFHDTNGIWYTCIQQHKLDNRSGAPSEEDTLGDLLQRPKPHAIVLAIQHIPNPDGLVFGELDIQHGVFGACQPHGPGDALLIAGQRIIAIVKMGASRQYLMAAVHGFADEALASILEPGATTENHGDTPAVESSGGEAKPTTIFDAIKAFATQKLEADHKLMRTANAVYNNELTGLMISIIRILSGNYGIVVDEYPSTQDWIVD